MSPLAKCPLVSIVTINYNQGLVTGALLHSLQKVSYPNIEVIVVDNGSKDAPLPEWTTIFKGVNVVLAGENLGFAGGNNLGRQQARGDYIFFLNNDTEVLPDTISILVDAFEKNSGVGVVSPKIKYYHDPTRIQYAGMTTIHPLTGRNRSIGYNQVDIGQFDVGQPTAYAHGAAMMVKNDVISVVGGMPEMFFLYYEELDWCEKIRKAGYCIYYEPKAVVYHKQSATIGEESPVKTYYHSRNRILFMSRNTTRLQFFFFSIFFCTFTMPRYILSNLFKGNLSHIKAFIQGVWWNLSRKVGSSS